MNKPNGPYRVVPSLTLFVPGWVSPTGQGGDPSTARLVPILTRHSYSVGRVVPGQGQQSRASGRPRSTIHLTISTSGVQMSRTTRRVHGLC